jgi:hypothetical protein
MDVSESQESILEDHLLLCNRINLHRCSDYCLRAPKNSPSSSLKPEGFSGQFIDKIREMSPFALQA